MRTIPSRKICMVLHFSFLFASFQCNYLYVTYSIHIEQLQSRCNRQWWRWWRCLWIYTFEMIWHIPCFFKRKSSLFMREKERPWKNIRKKSVSVEMNQIIKLFPLVSTSLNYPPNKSNVPTSSCTPLCLKLSTPFLLQLNKLSPKTVVTSFMQ